MIDGDTYQEREDTIRRLRGLHGSLEMSLLIAADALAEIHPEMPATQWFETLLREGMKKLVDNQRLSGRLAFFSDDEITGMAVAFDELASPLADEVRVEQLRRGPAKGEDRGTRDGNGDGEDRSADGE